MGRACSTHGKLETLKRLFLCRLKGKDHSEDQGVDDSVKPLKTHRTMQYFLSGA
jgi:hypothetical protein